MISDINSDLDGDSCRSTGSFHKQRDVSGQEIYGELEKIVKGKFSVKEKVGF